MRHQSIKATAVFVAMLALLSGAGVGLAQNPSSSSGSAGGDTPVQVQAGIGLPVPAGFTVIPPDDTDTSDDQIVQLENLTIQSMTSGKVALPMIIYASRDLGGPCREYLDVQGTSGSRIYPCPLAPTVLYQITVESDTILLLKNRARAGLSDFAVGDHINVFGFMDRGTSGVQALIVRNLDKPAVSQYVQLNDLTLVSDPTSSVPPATFRAARKGVEPCLQFTPAAPRGMTTPCPMGVDISASAEELKSSATADIYRPFRQYYNIQVTANTRLMNVNRRTIPLSEFQTGDRVNVYGRYIPGTRTVEALIVRNLSVPRSVTTQASLVVSVTDTRIVCITVPCGQVNGATVDVHWLDYEGDDTPTVVASQTTVNGQASFRNLKPGRYLVTASGEGFSSVGQQVVLRAGQTGKVSLFVGTDDDGRSPSISSISPSRGAAGSRVTLRGRFARTGNYVYVGGYNAGENLESDGTTLTFEVPEWVSPCPYNPYEPGGTEPRACIAIALQIKVGKHAVYVVNANGASNSVTFEVTSVSAL